MPATQFLQSRIADAEVFAFRNSTALKQYDAILKCALFYVQDGINDPTARKIFEEQALRHPAQIFVSELGHGLDTLATKFLADFLLIADIQATGVVLMKGVVKPYIVAETDLWKSVHAGRRRRARYTDFVKRRREQRLSSLEYNVYMAKIKKDGPPVIIAPTPESARSSRQSLIEKRRLRRAANYWTNFARTRISKKKKIATRSRGLAPSASEPKTKTEAVVAAVLVEQAMDIDHSGSKQDDEAEPGASSAIAQDVERSESVVAAMANGSALSAPDPSMATNFLTGFLVPASQQPSDFVLEPIVGLPILSELDNIALPELDADAVMSSGATLRRDTIQDVAGNSEAPVSPKASSKRSAIDVDDSAGSAGVDGKRRKVGDVANSDSIETGDAARNLLGNNGTRSAVEEPVKHTSRAPGNSPTIDGADEDGLLVSFENVI